LSPAAETEPGKVTAVRFWSLGDLTRVAVELDSGFSYKHGRLADPDRLFFDIAGTRPQMAPKGTYVVPIGDGVVKQIRVAETQPGVTRVVLDLEGRVEFTASQLSQPARLMIELRSRETPWPAPATLTAVTAPGSTPNVEKPRPRAFVPPVVPPAPARPAAIVEARLMLPPPVLASLGKAPRLPTGAAPPWLPPPPAAAEPTSRVPAGRTESAAINPPAPARKNSGGGQSLTRVLGLKLGRVVLDPGHGGHDEGTRGPTGLAEKDLVLDVAHRLGALLEDRLGSEVVYTRNEDRFVALEDRTRIANEHRADLFLSIHANSSPVRSVSGVETYYLSFTTSKAALELASRENATSRHSIFELKELLAKIALKDKVDESREFASRLQSSLHSLSARDNKAARNRGVKRAPFVVLIGADMPSVLAEIGFLTNASDEALLRREEHRDKIAEALYRGISSYVETLSRSVVARRQ
jgi:N-acetylmuramoyl-L-alanine amidase